MQTFAQTLELVDGPERIAEYVVYHERVWPEVVAGLRAIGIRSLQIFLRGNRLFMVYTAPDDFRPSAGLSGLRSRPSRGRVGRPDAHLPAPRP